LVWIIIAICWNIISAGLVCLSIELLHAFKKRGIVEACLHEVLEHRVGLLLPVGHEFVSIINDVLWEMLEF
jgi:hypothetical protein